jgi:hypothetical protein
MSVKVLDLALYKEHEVVEELRFVDDDEVDVLGDVVGHLHEVCIGGVAWHADVVVRDNLGVEGVAVVATRFDDEDARADAPMASHHGCDEGGLAREHGTHNDFKTHSVLCYEFLVKRNYPFSQEKISGLKVRINYVRISRSRRARSGGDESKR